MFISCRASELATEIRGERKEEEEREKASSLNFIFLTRRRVPGVYFTCGIQIIPVQADTKNSLSVHAR